MTDEPQIEALAATEPDDAPPGHGTPAPGGSARRARRLPRPLRTAPPRGLLIGAAALAPVLLVAAVVMAVLWDGARSDADDLDGVRRVAGTFADRFLTLDSTDLDRTKDGVLELSTGAFRRTYEEGLEAGVLQAILDLGQTRTDTTVEEILVGDVDARTAHAIVRAETLSRTTSPDGAEQPPRRVSFWLELDLVKQGGDWLVDGVRNLNFGRTPAPAGDPEPGA